ncbi:hypothetical protein JCM16138_15000 [Thermococcus atlanticus]
MYSSGTSCRITIAFESSSEASFPAVLIKTLMVVPDIGFPVFTVPDGVIKMLVVHHHNAFRKMEPPATGRIIAITKL